jgi:hypothetical protein
MVPSKLSSKSGFDECLYRRRRRPYRDGNHGEIRLSGILRVGERTTDEERRDKCPRGLGDNMVA